MPDLQQKLSGCFSIVFPSLTADQIVNASPASVAAWDSVASITLVTVIEEEFGVAIDLEVLSELTCFNAFERYIKTRL